LEETATSVYFPSPFLSTNDSPFIYISGESQQVARVKERLNQLANEKVYQLF
jgi:hypothetical protein